MVQINLLPDLVLNRRRAARLKRMATLGLVGWLALLGAATLLTFLYLWFQSASLDRAQKQFTEINDRVHSAENDAFRAEALEVQSSLTALSELFSQQRRVSDFGRTLGRYTPQGVKVNDVALTPDNSVTISGSATSYMEASKMVEAMKASPPVSTDQTAAPLPYFSGVQLISATSAENNAVMFAISAQYITATSVTEVQP